MRTSIGVAGLALLAISTSGCSSAPATPTPTDGVVTWSGRYAQTACNLTGPPGKVLDPRTCAHHGEGDAVLVLTSDGAGQVTMTLTLASDEHYSFVVTAVGTLKDGALAVDYVRQTGATATETWKVRATSPSSFQPLMVGTVEKFWESVNSDGRFTDRREYAVSVHKASATSGK